MNGDIKLATPEQIISRQQEKITELEVELRKIRDARSILKLAEGLRLETAAKVLVGLLSHGYDGNDDAMRRRADIAVKYADILIDAVRSGKSDDE